MILDSPTRQRVRIVNVRDVSRVADCRDARTSALSRRTPESGRATNGQFTPSLVWMPLLFA
jgi:hypothetical protein